MNAIVALLTLTVAPRARLAREGSVAKPAARAVRPAAPPARVLRFSPATAIDDERRRRYERIDASVDRGRRAVPPRRAVADRARPIVLSSSQAPVAVAAQKQVRVESSPKTRRASPRRGVDRRVVAVRREQKKSVVSETINPPPARLAILNISSVAPPPSP